jgi:hypothetical protein
MPRSLTELASLDSGLEFVPFVARRDGDMGAKQGMFSKSVREYGKYLAAWIRIAATHVSGGA